MENFINKLVEAKGYDEELKRALLETIPVMIKHYGEEYEMLILEAISSCDIYQCKFGETMYDVHAKYSKQNIENDVVVKESTLKIASGVHHSEPEIIYTENGYEVVNVARVVAISSQADLSGDFGKRTLIHELGHLVKGYQNEYVIVGDKLFERTGFISREYQLSIDEFGNVQKNLLMEKNVGLEEGLNSYDEATIFSMISGKERKYDGYVPEATIAERLHETLGLKSEIIASQFTGDFSIIKEKYNSASEVDNFDELSMFVEESVKLNYEMHENIFLCISDKEEEKQKWQSIVDARTNAVAKAFNNISKVQANMIESSKQL